MSKYVIIWFILSLPVFANSQNALTPEDRKYIKTQTSEYLKAVFSRLEQLGSSGQGMTDGRRNRLIETILSYFEDTTKVQVINLSKRKNTYKIDNYLRNVVANYTKRYDIVILDIEVKSFKISDLNPVKDSTGQIILYKCSYTFIQGFCAKKKNETKEAPISNNPDDFDICEETTKSGEVIVKRSFSQTKGDRWVISLGNIKANHIKNRKSED